MKGQSTIEILIAIAVLATAIGAALVSVFGGQSLSLDSGESAKALRIAQQSIEQTENRARFDFDILASSSAIQDEFSKQISVENASSGTKKVTVRVSWNTDPLRTQKVELVTYVTNWYQNNATGGDTGGGGLGGNWNNPQTLGSIDLGAGESATDLDVVNKIVYMTAIASDPKKADFFVVDATNGQSPSIISSIDTGPGLNALDAAGSYAYAAQNKTSNQLQVISISDKNNPTSTSQYTLPGVSGAGAVGWSIFYYNSKVYVGTKNASGPEFHIIDVSNPASPTEVGSYEVGADVNKIVVRNSTAYLATTKTSSQLLILDVSNPSSITKIGSYNSSANANSLHLVGSKLYLGLAQNASSELRVLDISNASSVSVLGSAEIGSDINDLTVRDYLAFLATSDSNNEFQVWDISNDANINKVSSFNFPQVANGIDYEDNLVYVAVRSNDGLRIITSQ